MEVNAYNNLNISNLTTNTNSANPASTSLFNQLIAQNDSNEVADESTTQGLSLKDRVKDAINKVNEDDPITSDKSNTHDELMLMLKLKNLQAS